MTKIKKLAIVATHPIQYQAPWFQFLAAHSEFDIHVFYLWNPEDTEFMDSGFNRSIVWDVPLTEGYTHSFICNIASRPGTFHYRGLDNPDLANAILKYQPQAVLCLAYRYRSIIRLLRHPEFKRIPFLLRGDSHCLVPEPFLKKMAKRFLLPVLFKRFSAALYVGSASRDYFKHYGVSEDQLFLVPHVLDPALFKTTPAHRITTSPLRIFFSGKLEAKKRPELLLKQFLSLGLADAELHFIGDGPLRQSLHAMSAGCTSVVFHGFINQSHLPTLYSQASLFVLPSYAHETWGLVIQEAALLGIPSIISSTVGCITDLIEHKKSGYVFDSFNPDSLKDLLLYAANNRDQLYQLGTAARERASHYTLESATNGLAAALTYASNAV